MRLCEALGLPESGVLSLVGGGGKSSLLLRLTKEWSVVRRVVAVTTTHITRAQGEALGLLLLGGSPDALHAALREHSAVCAAGRRFHSAVRLGRRFLFIRPMAKQPDKKEIENDRKSPFIFQRGYYTRPVSIC